MAFCLFFYLQKGQTETDRQTGTEAHRERGVGVGGAEKHRDKHTKRGSDRVCLLLLMIRLTEVSAFCLPSEVYEPKSIQIIIK